MRAAAPLRATARQGARVVATFVCSVAVVGCGAPDQPREGAQVASPGAAAATPVATTAPSTSAAGPPQTRAVEGAVVRFSGGGTSVDVVLGPETPTTRDLVSLLPFTMQLEDLSGREKIGDPPRELDVEGTPGSDPEDGDLIYFTPWGNLGFYYDATGIEHSDATLHLGTYRASEEQLSRFEGEQVRVELVG